MTNKKCHSASRNGNSANADYTITNKGLKLVSTFSYSLTDAMKTSITLGTKNSTQVGLSTSIYAGGKVGISAATSLDIKGPSSAYKLSEWKVVNDKTTAAKKLN